MIQVSDLNYVYKKSGKLAVKQVNFDIKQGEIFGFLGPSGAGKTTTQRLIIGLLRGYTGHIQVMGKERSAWGKGFYEDIGVAFDFPNLYLKLTALENLKLVSAYYKRKPTGFNTLLDRVGLLEDQHKKVESYSKGMKMRLNFIRALMHEPKLLFFDEPTSGLDPINGKIIKDTLLGLKSQGKTIFLTTHNMTVAEQLCDRVALIVDGEIKEIDSPKNLTMRYGESAVKVEYMDGSQVKEATFNLDSINHNQSFMNVIQSKKILTMHSGEATLEDVFIKLTGRNLQ
ncbi:ABC transporter ATP-binding protein [Vallitalea pronyensis]|uniref:ABC transporter ATP-binding protein n=1 Tax=Vallitalea pronyensis TaxID=1348613 RepID=A0A8J8MJQ4_9FIRM|nr:ABC transporter ATP-binding protein [Vallitalea pronyensis]QUI22672.1 ABC transporter ATP-binding protein [Vallitalea pronyensis]